MRINDLIIILFIMKMNKKLVHKFVLRVFNLVP